MIRFAVFVLFLAVVALLSGCATLSSEQCSDGAWYEIGVVDGRYGRASSVIDQHRRECGSVDDVAYSAGRVIGLRDYCRPEHGFTVGERSQLYQGVCKGGEFDESAFLAERQRGQLLAEGLSRRAALEKRVEEAAKESAKEKSNDSVPSSLFTLAQYATNTHPTQFLARDRADIEVRVAALEDAAPPNRLSTSMMADDNAILWSTTGAAVGTLTGFGLGHALQDRYWSSGWKWTAAEGALLAGAIASSSAYCAGEPDVARGRTRSVCSNSVPMLAILGLVGVHIWQAVDLWTEASRVSRGYSRTNLTIVPRMDVPGVVAVVGF